MDIYEGSPTAGGARGEQSCVKGGETLSSCIPCTVLGAKPGTGAGKALETPEERHAR